MLGYLAQAGPLHPKHGGPSPRRTSSAHSASTLLPPLHPSLTLLLHYAIAVPSILWVHDAVFADPGAPAAREDDDTLLRRQHRIATALCAYTLVLFATRYLSSYRAGRLRQHAVLYEFTWLCNATLVLGCVSFGGGGPARDRSWLFRRRPLVATACCVAVSVDQLLWYVDAVGWAVTGAFPVGVMKYLTWRQTLWIDRCTCTHHLWTLPVLVYGAGAPLTWASWQLSAYVVVVHVVLSRWLTPRCLRSGDAPEGDGRAAAEETDPRCYRYLNVNLSHELWKDISFSWLQISLDHPPAWVYLLRLLWRWQFFNGLMFMAILRPLSNMITTQHDKY